MNTSRSGHGRDFDHIKPCVAIRGSRLFGVVESPIPQASQQGRHADPQLDLVCYDGDLHIVQRTPLTLAGFPDDLHIRAFKLFHFKGQLLCSVVVSAKSKGPPRNCLARLNLVEESLSYLGILRICGEELDSRVPVDLFDASGRLGMVLFSPPGYLEARLERFAGLDFSVTLREHIDLASIWPDREKRYAMVLRASHRLDDKATLLVLEAPPGMDAEMPAQLFLLRRRGRWGSKFLFLEQQPAALSKVSHSDSESLVLDIVAAPDSSAIGFLMVDELGRLSYADLKKGVVTSWPWKETVNLSSRLVDRYASSRTNQQLEDVARRVESHRVRKQPLRGALRCARYLSDFPGSGRALTLMATALGQYGEKYDALAVADRAARTAPKELPAWYTLARFLEQTRLRAQAAEVYRSALRYFPYNLTLVKDYAFALVNLFRFEEAIEFVDGYADRCGNMAKYLMIKGDLMYRVGRFHEASETFEKLLNDQTPESGLRALERYIGCLRETGRVREALGRCDEHLEKDPASGAILMQQALCYEDLADYENAIRSFDGAIARLPDSPGVRFNRAHAKLITGRFEEGWADYEYRFYQHKLVESVLGDRAPPIWDGSPAPDKRLLVIAGQGRGDGIQFCRYLPVVKRMVGELIVASLPDLFPIFSALDCVDRIHDKSTDSTVTENADLYAPLESLPYLLGVTRESIDGAAYLNVTSFHKDFDMEFDKDRLKVGICAQGNPLNHRDHHRSMSLDALKEIQYIDSVRCYSLHKPMRQESHEDGRLVCDGVIDCSGHISTLADTAALIANMDVIVSVDTVVAHLAGAMGKPVWTMACYNPHWIYMVGESTCPWYRSIKVFRQAEPGCWETVVRDVVQALRHWPDRTT